MGSSSHSPIEVAVEIENLALPSSAGASPLPSVDALESGCGAMTQPAQLSVVVEAAKGQSCCQNLRL